MADLTRELQIIISARDEASKAIQGVGGAFGDLVQKSQAASIAFAGVLGLVGKNILDAASDMEQAKVAFTTFEGSASAASKTLKELSDFAKVTPFTFPTITEAAKRLMAYGVAADDLIPTLKNLGDISAGVGTDKLPQLILAFGQVKAKTTLAGTELRQFTETGIPIIEALVNVINKSGAAMGTTAVKTKGTAEEIGNLNDKLAIAKQKLAEVTSNTKAKTSAVMSAKDAVQNYEQKLAAATATTGGFGAASKVTAADIADMASKGQISFDMVQQALQSMTGEGGKFFNLMDKQSVTFSGRMSNISDQLTRVALNIAGISTEADTFGNVIEGGAFDLFSKGAQKVLDILNELEPKVKGFISAFLANKSQIAAVLGILVGGLLGAAVAMASFLAPLIALMAIGAAVGVAIEFLSHHMAILTGVVAGLGVVVVAMFTSWAAAAIPAAIATIAATWPLLALAVAVGVVAAGIYMLVTHFDEIKAAILSFTTQSIAAVSQFVNSIITWFSVLPDTVNAFFVDLFVNKIPYAVGFAAGWLYTNVPLMVQGIITWFSQLPGAILAILIQVKDFIIQKFTEAIVWLATELMALPGKVQKWISSIPGIVGGIFEAAKQAVLDAMSSMFSGVSQWWDKVKGVLEGIKNAAEAAANAVKKGFDAGKNVKSFQHGGFVPGSFNQAVPAILHGGERIVPRNGTDVNAGGGSAGAVTINITGSFNLDSSERVNELANKVISLLGRQNELAAKGVAF